MPTPEEDTSPDNRRRPGVLLAIGLLACAAVGCARSPEVLRVRLDGGRPPAPASLPTPLASPGGYAEMLPAISAVLVGELGLPLPSDFAVYLYPDRTAYAEGLGQLGQMPPDRARLVAGYSVGLSQDRRLFLNADALRDLPTSARVAIVAHELTHLAQYELSGGRRGRSEQWLREGMADWVACRVLERLGESTFPRERDQALRDLALDLHALDEPPLDLVDLGRPRRWEARHLQVGDRLTYRLAFLLTDELVRRDGLDRLLAYFRAFAESDDRFGNFERAFGTSLVEFEHDALARIRAELTALTEPGTPAPAAPFSASER